jgi:hypothetical protein
MLTLRLTFPDSAEVQRQAVFPKIFLKKSALEDTAKTAASLRAFRFAGREKKPRRYASHFRPTNRE